jgi:serine/threonine-protein kinase
VRALALELVEGPTLAERIVQGPIPVDEAVSIARQIAEALAAAHERGIVHRDLKPANIKLRPDGVVKVLDFGLAKVLEPLAEAATAPLHTSNPAITDVGLILGTAAYMSPEQARGRPTDKRCDVWAFVRVSDVTGRRAFAADDISDTLVAVLRGEPDWTLPSVIPTSVELIEGCLQKDSSERIVISRSLDFCWAINGSATLFRPISSRLSFWRRAAPLATTAVIAAGIATWVMSRLALMPRMRAARFSVAHHASIVRTRERLISPAIRRKSAGVPGPAARRAGARRTGN